MAGHEDGKFHLSHLLCVLKMTFFLSISAQKSLKIRAHFSWIKMVKLPIFFGPLKIAR